MTKLSLMHLLAAAISISAPAFAGVFGEPPKSTPKAAPSKPIRQTASKGFTIVLVTWKEPPNKKAIPM